MSFDGIIDWFNGKKDDWLIVEHSAAQWSVTNFGTTNDEHCSYIIEYSESRHTVRLRVIGYKPRKHKYYHKSILPYYLKCKAYVSTNDADTVTSWIREVKNGTRKDETITTKRVVEYINKLKDDEDYESLATLRDELTMPA